MTNLAPAPMIAGSRPGLRSPLAPVLLIAALVLTTPCRAEELDDEYRAGLVATLIQQGKEVGRRVEQRAIVVPTAATPDGRLQAGMPFGIRWRGLFETDGAGKYRFSAYVTGSVKMKVGDATVLEGSRDRAGWLAGPPVSLPYDWLPLAIEFRSPGRGGELRLFWEGPEFQLEPIPTRVFSHEAAQSAPDTFEQGRELVQVLRCAKCHELPDPALPAPSLAHVGQTLNADYVRTRLTEPASAASSGPKFPGRNMPYFGLSPDDADAIVAYLWSQSRPLPKPTRPWQPATRPKKKKAAPTISAADHLKFGRQLVHSLGCLACHSVQGLGNATRYDGPPLDEVATKRPPGFAVRWLQDPESMQPEHQMPRFDLTKREGEDIAAWLEHLSEGTQATSDRKPAELPARSPALIRRGAELVTRLRCASCHQLNAAPPPPRRPAPTKWGQTASCVAAQGKGPIAYALAETEAAAVRHYLQKRQSVRPLSHDGVLSLRRRRCLNCHRRDQAAGLAPIAAQVAERLPELASRIPAMMAPPLDSVGDKLNDEALRAFIERKHATLRSYLDVRMPTFRFDEHEVDSIVQTLIAEDRIPDGYPAAETTRPLAVDAVTLRAAGARLVTSDGFGCTSCHAVGGVLPAEAPLNARGPELTQPGKRIRASWFRRWVRNPSRIVPRMEMPGVKLAVHGVLNDDLNQQLDAIWQVLNQPDFVPPAPNPVRIVRKSGVPNQKGERAVFVTDVVRQGSRSWIKPLLIGLPNRHNILLNLAEGRMELWTTGDTARQRTEGKSWYWELGGAPVWQAASDSSGLELRRGATRLIPERAGQFVTEFDVVEHEANGTLSVVYRLPFNLPNGRQHQLRLRQRWQPVFDGRDGEGFNRTVEVDAVPDGWQLVLKPLPGSSNVRATADGRRLSLAGPAKASAIVLQGDVSLATDGGWRLNSRRVVIGYRAQVQVDRFPFDAVTEAELEPQKLNVLPGFVTTRLAFPEEIMPTGLGWLPGGRLAFTSLKGRVWLAEDRDHDGLEEVLWPASDELAAPYGLHAEGEYVDVINKYALLRLTDVDHDGRFDRYETVASGWGHTADYHDWAVGLPRDEQGAYYVALPCQQDERDQVAARYRGKVLRLVPRTPTRDNPHRFSIQVVSGGHRFPMGIARNREGELFVTDNQGNYNPFNELNHVLPGKRYGFYNAIEKKQGLTFPTTPPAVRIPHPWTRSVNGICFLESPNGAPPRRFGPFEGDLVGCEFNERLLIRISLEQVQGRIQGAAYPFTWRQPPSGPPLLGPVACAVSPKGDLYVGCLRDSGWGGANNIGSVVQCRPDLANLPPGISHMKIEPDGFRITLTRPVDPHRAANKNLYRLASYTRISTPAYGGPDVDRSVESIRSVDVNDAGTEVTLHLARPIKRGYVYELHIEPSLASDDVPFFPAEAHYTVWELPATPRP